MFMQTFSLLKTCLQQEVLDTARINMHSSLWIHNSSRVKDTFVHPSYPSAPYPQECLLECNPHTRALRFTLNASYIWTRTHSYAHRVAHTLHSTPVSCQRTTLLALQCSHAYRVVFRWRASAAEQRAIRFSKG